MGLPPTIQAASANWIPNEIPLTPACVIRLRKSYSWFAASLALTFVGGSLGARSEAWLNQFQGWPGWVIALAALYCIPVAANAARTTRFRYSWPMIAALLGNALLSGFLFAPFARLASTIAPPAVTHTGAVTAVVFAAVSAYILSRDRTFAARSALLIGLAASAVAALLSAMVLGFHWVGFPVAMVAGGLGVVILINAITELLQDAPSTPPVDGALLLFAGTCNVAFSLAQMGLRATRKGA